MRSGGLTGTQRPPTRTARWPQDNRWNFGRSTIGPKQTFMANRAEEFEATIKAGGLWVCDAVDERQGAVPLHRDFRVRWRYAPQYLFGRQAKRAGYSLSQSGDYRLVLPLHSPLRLAV